MEADSITRSKFNAELFLGYLPSGDPFQPKFLYHGEVTWIVGGEDKERQILLQSMVEALIVNEIPVIAFEWDGEFDTLSSLNDDPVLSNLVSESYFKILKAHLNPIYYEFNKNAGNPIHIPLFTPAPKFLGNVHQQVWNDRTAHQIATLAGYDLTESDKVRTYLIILVMTLIAEGHPLSSFSDLLDAMNNDKEILHTKPKKLIKKKDRQRLIERIGKLALETDIWHNVGMELNMEMLEAPGETKLTKIISLSSIEDHKKRENHLIEIFHTLTRELEMELGDSEKTYNGMVVLTFPPKMKDPLDLFIRLLNFIDVARKHGIGIIVSIPNVNDISNAIGYKLKLVDRWIFGPHTQPYDRQVIRSHLRRTDLTAGKDKEDDIMEFFINIIAEMTDDQFLYVEPKNSDEFKVFNIRELFTK